MSCIAGKFHRQAALPKYSKKGAVATAAGIHSGILLLSFLENRPLANGRRLKRIF